MRQAEHHPSCVKGEKRNQKPAFVEEPAGKIPQPHLWWQQPPSSILTRGVPLGRSHLVALAGVYLGALTLLPRQIRKCMTQSYVLRKHLLCSKKQGKRNTTGMPPGALPRLSSGSLGVAGRRGSTLCAVCAGFSQTSYLKQIKHNRRNFPST